ncbi:aspartate/glutamate racemase family protein [Henriciella sp. AS95]|uniref:aspartate/glutamate racemase family protein n=1 Tax=Henriciella sp. AS95 TaxID=3135782 RepID=UPI003175FC19
MTYRIAILGTGDGNTDQADVPDPIREVAGAGFEPVLIQVPNSTFPGTPEARLQVVDAYTAAGIAAEKDGFDAVFINTMGDYGLAELRNAVSIPVTGAGEVSVRLAMQLGRGFSIVSLWPPRLRFLLEHVLQATGTADDCHGLHFMSQDQDLETMGEEGNAISQMQACQYVPMQQVIAKCRDVLSHEDTDVLVLGCTCMAGMGPILKAEGLSVIEPMRAGYLATELLLRVSA